MNRRGVGVKDRLTAETILATAHIQGTCRGIRPLKTPAGVAFALAVTLRGAILATEVGSKTANTFTSLRVSAGSVS